MSTRAGWGREGVFLPVSETSERSERKKPWVSWERIRQLTDERQGVDREGKRYQCMAIGKHV